MDYKDMRVGMTVQFNPAAFGTRSQTGCLINREKYDPDVPCLGVLACVEPLTSRVRWNCPGAGCHDSDRFWFYNEQIMPVSRGGF